jgi:hypothetical protein
MSNVHWRAESVTSCQHCGNFGGDRCPPHTEATPRPPRRHPEATPTPPKRYAILQRTNARRSERSDAFYILWGSSPPLCDQSLRHNDKVASLATFHTQVPLINVTDPSGRSTRSFHSMSIDLLLSIYYFTYIPGKFFFVCFLFPQ